MLPDLTYEEGVEDSDIPVLTFVPVPNGTELDAGVLAFCYKQARKVADIAGHLGVSDSTYLRKQVLENLAEHQYLEKNKVSRATYFKTNPEMVKVE